MYVISSMYGISSMHVLLDIISTDEGSCLRIDSFAIIKTTWCFYKIVNYFLCLLKSLHKNKLLILLGPKDR